MELRTVLAPAARGMNAVVMAMGSLPVIGPRIRDSIAEVTYVGRRSGRTISTPVSARRSGDTVTIGVAMPDQKTWWRNFLGEGAPISVRLGETTHTGHGVAHRDDKGNVTVQVQLDSPQ